MPLKHFHYRTISTIISVQAESNPKPAPQNINKGCKEIITIIYFSIESQADIFFSAQSTEHVFI